MGFITSMTWKRSINTSSAGTAAKFGAADLNKVIDFLDAVADVDSADIDSSTTVRSGKFKIRNPGNTFSYSIIAAAIAANRNITLPLLAGNDTLVTEAFTQTLSNKTLTSSTLTSPVLTTPTINGATIGDATNIVLNTTTGTKIGTDPAQKLAFYNATPVGQRTGIADVDSSTVDNTYGQAENDVITSLRTKVNAIIQVLEDMGITAVV